MVDLEIIHGSRHSSTMHQKDVTRGYSYKEPLPWPCCLYDICHASYMPYTLKLITTGTNSMAGMWTIWQLAGMSCNNWSYSKVILGDHLCIHGLSPPDHLCTHRWSPGASISITDGPPRTWIVQTTCAYI